MSTIMHDSTTTATTTDQTKYGAPDPSDPTDTRKVWGYCASFCISDGPTDGASVEDHGDHCESGGMHVEARDAQRDEVDIFTGAAKAYFHGTVHRSLTYRSANAPKVELSILAHGCDFFEEPTRFYMTASDARSLARHLSLFADVADGCTGNPNEALARRELELAGERAAAEAATLVV